MNRYVCYVRYVYYVLVYVCYVQVYVCYVPVYVCYVLVYVCYVRYMCAMYRYMCVMDIDLSVSTIFILDFGTYQDSVVFFVIQFILLL